MKGNLNAVHGAIQQVDKLIALSEQDKSMLKEKEEALKDSDKLMKAFKTFVKEQNIDDFEEDVLKETPPNTADAMKRYKAGKGGLQILHILKESDTPEATVKRKYQTNISKRKKMKTFRQHIKEGYKQDATIGVGAGH